MNKRTTYFCQLGSYQDTFFFAFYLLFMYLRARDLKSLYNLDRISFLRTQPIMTYH